MVLTPNFCSVIGGKLLLDGCLEKHSLNSNTRFKFKKYIERAYCVLVSFLSLYPYCSSFRHLTKAKRKGEITMTYNLIHYIYLVLMSYLNYFIEKKNVIPDNIYDLLTPIAITHWVTGDGAVLNKGLVLCTGSYSNQEV
uniref:hypothetical protein n=1 Tax=Fuscoporia gilva TaxID=40471 RepID=UPI0023D8B057|nr:hypothetical protein P2X57_mgp22 [Fuscoporia gilva]WDD39643.1 hypothetical protein [Fuscoporia gilva]